MTYKDALFEVENWSAIPEGPFNTTQHRKLCNDDKFSFLHIIHAVLSNNKVFRDKVCCSKDHQKRFFLPASILISITLVVLKPDLTLKHKTGE